MYLTGIYFAGYAVSAVTGALMNQTNLTYTITDCSTDSTTWTTIYTMSTATPYDISLHTYTMSSIPYYKAIRFILTSINGNDALYLTGIYFAGYSV